MARKEAPIFADTFRLCEWTLGHFDSQPGVLARSLSALSLELYDTVSLALRGYERGEMLEDADRNLVKLRGQLRMACAVGLLHDQQLCYALELADQIGRQLGGWQRRIGVA